MMKLLQYLILFILVGNGLQPYLEKAGFVVDTKVEVAEEADESDCPLDESTEEESEPKTDDFADSENSQLVEPKPNEFQTSNGSNLEEDLDNQVVISPVVEDWSIDSHLEYVKISTNLKEHLHFSKRAFDDTVLI